MADPLSITVGVAGALTAAAQISTLLIRFTKSTKDAPAQARHVTTEVNDTSAILSHLQSLLISSEFGDQSRTSLLKVEHVVAIASGCVLTFSDLEKLLDELKTDGMGALDCMKWARKETEIHTLLQRLQNHKASLSLMLEVLNGANIMEAKGSVDRLYSLVEKHYQSILSRLQTLELRELQRMAPTPVVPPITDDISVHYDQEAGNGGTKAFAASATANAASPAFYEELKKSRAYRRDAVWRMSTCSTDRCTTTCSTLTALSLAEVSHVSLMNLAITIEDVYNPQRVSQTWSKDQVDSQWPSQLPFQDLSLFETLEYKIFPANMAIQWPNDRVLRWLASNGFSNEWQIVFKSLDIQGESCLALRHGFGQGISLMHQMIYPRLTRECSASGVRWDQERERGEGRRMRRAIKELVKGTDGKYF